MIYQVGTTAIPDTAIILQVLSIKQYLVLLTVQQILVAVFALNAPQMLNVPVKMPILLARQIFLREIMAMEHFFTILIIPAR